MLGERIALLRRGQGWSQAHLAQRLHISPSAVGMYEQGRREPSLDALVELARVFGVSADYLLTGQPVSDQDRQVMDAVMHRNLQSVQGRRGLSREELATLFEAMLTEA